METSGTQNLGLSDEPQFDVALSFAGEQRAYVRRVASALSKRGVRNFFDEDQEVENWGKNLVEEFQRVYQHASRVVVMFISKEYAEKEWTRHERRSALNRAIAERREYVLPVRFDDTNIPGLDTSIGYISIDDMEPEELAAKVEKKLVSLGGRVVVPTSPGFTIVAAKRESATSEVTVLDQSGNPIADVQVVMIARNGTQTHTQTGIDGVARFTPQVRRGVSVFVAHPKFLAAYHRDHDNAENLIVTLPDGEGAGSIAFPDSTGYLPEFRPRLAPIGDAHDEDAVPRRIYMYVNNSSVNNQSEQPFHFSIGEPLLIEDAEGSQIQARLVGFVGRSTLWEYRNLK